MNFITLVLRLSFSVSLGLILSGCARYNAPFIMTSENLNLITGVREQNVLSPYLELNEQYLQGKLSVKVVTTLGDERVPSGHYFTGKYSTDGEINKQDGFTAEVTEVYFINNSDTNIKITPLNIEVADRGLVQLSDTEFTIPAYKAKISSKHVATTGIYLKKQSVKLHFLLDGNLQKLEGNVLRLSVND